MSIWKDEADFLKDVENISEFYISGNHNNPRNKFVFKSKKENMSRSKAWYDETDSEEEIDNYEGNYSCGRGRKTGGNTRNPGPEPDHHEVMREIQRQVRSVVGNRYNNEVLESYYNVCKDEDNDPDLSIESRAPKEVSISYSKEQRNRIKNAPNESLSQLLKKTSIVEDNQNATARVTEQKTYSPVASTSSSSSSSPRRTNKHHGNNSKRRCIH